MLACISLNLSVHQESISWDVRTSLKCDWICFFPRLDVDANVTHSWFYGILQLELENPFDIQ